MTNYSALAMELQALLLNELRAKGYAPNPADVLPAVNKLIAVIEKEKAVDTEPEPKSVAKLPEPAKEPAHPMPPALFNPTVPPKV